MSTSPLVPSLLTPVPSPLTRHTSPLAPSLPHLPAQFILLLLQSGRPVLLQIRHRVTPLPPGEETNSPNLASTIHTHNHEECVSIFLCAWLIRDRAVSSSQQPLQPELCSFVKMADAGFFRVSSS